MKQALLSPSILLLTALTIQGCGGGSDDNSKSPTTTPTPEVTNNIIGKWIDYFPENDCKEIHEYRADLTFTVEGNAAVIKGTYKVESSSNGSESVTLKFTEYNGGADCSNEFGDVVGLETTFSATYPENQLLLRDPSSNESIYELNRAISFITLSEEESLFANEQLSLKLVSDNDKLINPKIISAPSNTTLSETGELEWTAPESFFYKQTDYVFNVTADNTIDTFTGTIKVTDEKAGQPITSSFSLERKNDHEIVNADFDGDGKNEILLFNSGVISLVTLNNEGIHYKWSYPYTFESSPNLYVQAADINNDGKTDILVRDNKSIFKITDLNKPAEKIFSTTENDIGTFKIVDIDFDGSPEIVYSEGFGVADDIGIYDLQQNVILKKIPSDRDNGIGVFSVGNVDKDPQLEIVTSNGFVIDTETSERIRLYSKNDHILSEPMLVKFGNADYSMVIPHHTDSIEFWDAEKRTKELDFKLQNDQSVCTRIAANITTDDSEEIVFSECGLNSNVVLHAIDWENDQIKITETFSLSQRPHGYDYFFIGDIGQDAVPDIVYVTEKFLEVIPTNGSIRHTYSKSYDHDSYLDLGIGEISPGAFKQIGITYGDWSDEYFLVHLDESSPAIQQFPLQQHQVPLNPKTAKLTDIEGDGVSEVIFIEGLRNGSIGNFLVSLNANSAKETLRVPLSQGKVSQIQIYDVNDDGNQDAIIFYNDKIQVIELKNSDVHDVSGDIVSGKNIGYEVFGSETNNATILQYPIYSGGGSDDVIAKVFSLNSLFETSFIAKDQGSQSCSPIVPNEEKSKLYCIQHVGYGTSELVEFDLNLAVTRKTSITEPCGRNRNFRVSGNRAFMAYGSICEISIDTGKLQWQSPMINGYIAENGFHFHPKETDSDRGRLSFATRNGLFLTR